MFHVVDELGQPIVGAEAFATHEREHPRGGEFWHTGRATSDEVGVVQLRVTGPCDLVNVRAAGFADGAQSPGDLDVIVLSPARPAPIRVVDWLGRPATGELGYTRYCGHRPDLETATIGADGTAWLHRLGAQSRELYARCAGLGDEYVQIANHANPPGRPPRLLRLFASPAVHGRVIGRDGAPAANVPIGGASLHRGPWTHSAADGSFRLEFLPPNEDLAIDLGQQRHVLPRPACSVPCTLRLADLEAEASGVVRVHAARNDGAPLGDVDLGLGRRDGTTHTYVLAGRPPGDHALRLDEPDGAFESDEVAMVVTADGTTDVALSVRERPRVRFVVRGANVDEAPVPVELCAPRWTRDVSDLAGEPIPVPCDGDAAFWIGERAFPLPADFATRTEPIELVPPAPTIAGRLLDECGAPVRGTVTRGGRRATTAADGTFVLPAGVWPSDEPLVFARGDGSTAPFRTLPLVLPTAADDRLYDVGDVILWASGPLQFPNASGDAMEGSGALLRDGGEIGGFRFDAEGGYEGPEPRAGDRVRLQPFTCSPGDESVTDDVLPALTGPGPWRVRMPGGRLLLQVVDTQGSGLDGHVWLGRRSVAIRAGALELAGLAPGPHLLLLSAEGHRSATVRVVLAAGERRTLRVELPARPGR